MVTPAIITAYRHPFGVGDPYGDKDPCHFGSTIILLVMTSSSI
jgi:hypothetical protein